MLELLILLVAAHYLCDYPLLTEALVIDRRRKATRSWVFWLTFHASTHGVAVGLITGSIWLGLLEWVLHWMIDFYRADERYSIHVDQALHLLCKLLIVGLVFLV